MGTSRSYGVNRLARYIIMAVSVAAVLFLLWYFSNIVWYLLISAVLALMGKPVVRLLRQVHIGRFEMPSWLAATLTLILLWAGFLLFFLGIIPLVSAQLYQLRGVNVMEMVDKFSDQIDRLDQLIAQWMPSETQGFSLRDELTKYVSKLLNASFFRQLFSSTITFVTDLSVLLFSVSFITFFFLKDDKLFSDGFTFFFPARHQEKVRRSLINVDKLLRRYFVGLLIQCTVVCVLTAVGLVIFRIPFRSALTIGVLSGILNVIPYVGPLIAYVASELLVIATAVSMPLGYSLDAILFWLSMVFLIIRVLDNVFFQPIIFSSSAKAHPLEVFIVLLIASSLAGMLGMLLAIPVYTVLRVFAKEFFNNIEQVRKLTENL